MVQCDLCGQPFKVAGLARHRDNARCKIDRTAHAMKVRGYVHVHEYHGQILEKFHINVLRGPVQCHAHDTSSIHDNKQGMYRNGWWAPKWATEILNANVSADDRGRYLRERGRVVFQGHLNLNVYVVELPNGRYETQWTFSEINKGTGHMSYRALTKSVGSKADALASVPETHMGAAAQALGRTAFPS